jgi:UNC-50 family
LPDLCTDVVQFFLIPVVLGEGLVPMIIANSLYAAALSWYWYITHLGYRTLPFLSNTEVFLFPIAAVLLVFVVMLIGYPFNFGWNAARVMARFYFE